MKKLLLTTLATIAISVGALAQGTVYWSGVAGLLIAQTNSGTYSTFDGSGGSAGSGTQGNTLGNGTTLYYYELLVSATAVAAPTTLSALSAWSDTGLTAENGAASNGRISQLNPSTQAVANNWPASTTENIILVGWSASLGSTWSAALNELQNWSTDSIANGYFGVSSLGNLASQSGNPGVVVFGTGPGQINNAAGNPLVLDLVQQVPEPGTMALAALGGASMLLFRRKK